MLAVRAVAFDAFIFARIYVPHFETTLNTGWRMDEQEDWLWSVDATHSLTFLHWEAAVVKVSHPDSSLLFTPTHSHKAHGQVVRVLCTENDLLLGHGGLFGRHLLLYAGCGCGAECAKEAGEDGGLADAS